jgi:hypothetical protein
MLRNFVAAALLGLTLCVPVASAQYGQPPYRPRYEPRYEPRSEPRYEPRYDEDRGPYGSGEYPFPDRPSYLVQFRQPEWREVVHDSRHAMEEMVRHYRKNSWEVRVTPLGYDRYRVQYRLPIWGGSLYKPTMRDAREWARALEAREGYQTRVVVHPPEDER